MARLIFLGLLFFVVGAQVHIGDGEGVDAVEGSDIVRLKDPSLGLANEEELGDLGRREGKPVIGQNVTFDISGFSAGNEGEDLVAKEEHGRKEEEVEEYQGIIDTREEEWIEEAFIEGVMRCVLVTP